MTKQRDFTFDILRAIAIICVIFIHVNGLGYSDRNHNLGTDLGIIGRQICNFAVPLFLFISGYFMANKHVFDLPSYCNFLKKQIPRVLIPFIIWSIIYSLISILQGKDTISILKNFLTFQASGPFYYILLIIQYYLLSPIISLMSNSRLGVLSSMLISFASCLFIQFLVYIKGVHLPLFIYAGNFATWIMFPVFGMYIYKNNIAIKKNSLIIITLTLLTASVLTTFLLIKNFNNVATSVSAVKVSSFLYSISIILLFFVFRKSLKYNWSLVRIGELSFGIYFVHMMYIIIVFKIWGMVTSSQNFGNFPTQVIITILVLFISHFTGVCFRKVFPSTASKLLGF